MLYELHITNKTERCSFKSGCVVRVAKHLNEDWFVVLWLQLQLKKLCITVKSFIAYVLKCKTNLKVKFKCISATMHSLVMSPISSDLIKTDIDLLKYQQYLNMIYCFVL